MNIYFEVPAYLFFLIKLWVVRVQCKIGLTQRIIFVVDIDCILILHHFFAFSDSTLISFRGIHDMLPYNTTFCGDLIFLLSLVGQKIKVCIPLIMEVKGNLNVSSVSFSSTPFWPGKNWERKVSGDNDGSDTKDGFGMY